MLFLWSAFVLYALVLAGTALYALRRGGTEERHAIVVLLCAVVASQLASVLGARWRDGPEYGVMACDALLLLAFLVIVHRSRKFWPLWAAAAQLVAVVTHGVRFLDPSLARELYATIQPFWVFPVLIAIACGAYHHQQARHHGMST